MFIGAADRCASCDKEKGWKIKNKNVKKKHLTSEKICSILPKDWGEALRRVLYGR